MNHSGNANDLVVEAAQLKRKQANAQNEMERQFCAAKKSLERKERRGEKIWAGQQPHETRVEGLTKTQLIRQRGRRVEVEARRL